MSETKFTPGPWEVMEHSWSRTGIYGGGRGIAALDIYAEADNEADENELEVRMKADAKLIAAAPDLLAAAEWAANYIDTIMDRNSLKVREALLDAIHKALGETGEQS